MIRKTVSLTLLWSGLVEILTSVILYIQPQGRIAYWADWTFLGLSKEQWDAIHITVGVLFLAALFLHIYYNWKPIIAYLKKKADQSRFSNKAFTISLVLTLYVTFGTLFGLPPMQQIMDFSETIKQGHAETYGTPPYGHAELSSIKKIAKRTGINLQGALQALEQEDIEFSDENDSLKTIAKKNHVSPQQVFTIIQKAVPASPSVIEDIPTQTVDQPTEKQQTHTADTSFVHSRAPAGFGRMTLGQLCSQNGLDIRQCLKRLGSKGVDAKPDERMREIAERLGMSPRELWEMIK